MLDNAMYQIVLPIIRTGLTARGLSDVVVTQSDQPTHQGAVSARAVYLFKIGNEPFGYPRRDDVWGGAAEIHTEEQWDEATFQISALVTENPADSNSLTASDIVNIVKNIMQSDATRATLKNAGLGILRIASVRNPILKDDRDNFEASPSFDFILTDISTDTSVSPVANSVVFNIHRV